MIQRSDSALFASYVTCDNLAACKVFENASGPPRSWGLPRSHEALLLVGMVLILPPRNVWSVSFSRPVT